MSDQGPWTSATLAEARAMWARGVAADQIADRVGRSADAIYRAAKKGDWQRAEGARKGGNAKPSPPRQFSWETRA